MTVRIIKSVEIFYRESDTGRQVNLFTFASQKNTCLSDLMEDESIQGDLIYVVEFSDGVKKIVCHPKETRNEEWQVFELFKWCQHWYTIYEWLYKKEFRTKRPFQQYATRYEAEEARSWMGDITDMVVMFLAILIGLRRMWEGRAVGTFGLDIATRLRGLGLFFRSLHRRAMTEAAMYPSMRC